jgi:hypothetical protein
MSKDHIEHCLRMNRVSDAFGFETVSKAIHEGVERARRIVVRRLHRRIEVGESDKERETDGQ